LTLLVKLLAFLLHQHCFCNSRAMRKVPPLPPPTAVPEDDYCHEPDDEE
jgi:hypothetical protein